VQRPFWRSVFGGQEAGMGENPDHDREEVPGRPAISRENTREQAQEGREQRAEEGRGDVATRARLFFERLLGRR
jgi:hypothetical protein